MLQIGMYFKYPINKFDSYAIYTRWPTTYKVILFKIWIFLNEMILVLTFRLILLLFLDIMV